jgi:hypothetical protein
VVVDWQRPVVGATVVVGVGGTVVVVVAGIVVVVLGGTVVLVVGGTVVVVVPEVVTVNEAAAPFHRNSEAQPGAKIPTIAVCASSASPAGTVHGEVNVRDTPAVKAWLSHLEKGPRPTARVPRDRRAPTWSSTTSPSP